MGPQEEEAESGSGCRQRRAGDLRVGNSVGENGAEHELLMHRGQALMVFAKHTVKDWSSLKTSYFWPYARNKCGA